MGRVRVVRRGLEVLGLGREVVLVGGGGLRFIVLVMVVIGGGWLS